VTAQPTITIVAARGLGDTVCCLPAAYRYVADGYRVNLCNAMSVQFADTLPTLVPIGTEREGTVLDMSGGMAFGGECRVFAHVSLRLGVYPLAIPEGPWLRKSDEQVGMVRALGVPGEFVVVSCEGFSSSRRLEPEQVAAVVQVAEENGLATVVVCDKEHPEFDGLSGLNLTGKTTLPQLYALLAHARAAVCVDSGPLHTAAAFRTPVLAVVGQTLNPYALCEDYQPSLWLHGQDSFTIRPEDVAEGLWRLLELTE